MISFSYGTERAKNVLEIFASLASVCGRLAERADREGNCNYIKPPCRYDPN